MVRVTSLLTMAAKALRFSFGVKVLPEIKSQAFRENFSFNLVFPIIINLPTKRLHREKVFSINFFDPVQSIIKS